MAATISQQAFSQNLEDAGCQASEIDACWQLFHAGRQDALLALLAEHRRSLLARCHAEQHKLDCLDYLVYQLTHNVQQTRD